MRILNRPLGFLLAVALAVASVITIVEVIAVTVHAKPVLVPWHVWERWAGRTHWNRPVIKVWSIVLAAVGALILLIELKRSKPRRIPLASDNDATDAAMTRRGVTDTVQAAVLNVDGIRKATIITKRRTVTVAATTAAHDRSAADELLEPVTTAAQERLSALNLTRTPRVRVRVRTRNS